MDGKMLARIGAITFVAVALTVTAIELTRKDDAPTSSPMPQHRPATNPLRDAQRRMPARLGRDPRPLPRKDAGARRASDSGRAVMHG